MKWEYLSVANEYCIPKKVFKEKYGELPDEVGLNADGIRTAWKEKAIKDKEQLGRNLKIQKSLTDFLNTSDNPEEALLNLLRPDRINKSGGLGTTTLEYEQDAVIFRAHADLINMMQEYKPFLGIKPITDSDPRNVVRALFGDTVDDPYAAKFAEMWKSTVDKMSTRFIAAGGSIKKTGDWNLPQIHSTIKVANVGQEQWVNDIFDKLDWVKMKLADSGHEVKKQLLNDIYDTISTNGMNKGIRKGAKKIAKRRGGQRILQFKDSESWLSYQEKYGNQNVYSSMMDYINGMGKDIGAMEKFGSDPEAMFQLLSDYAVKTSKDATQATKRVTHAKKVWDNTMGHTAALDTKFAHRGAAIRNIMSATKLGSAILSALSDVSLLAVTSAFNGMPIIKPIFRMFSNIASGKESDIMSARLLLGMEHAIDAAHTANRYSDVVGHGFTSKFADFVIRSSGLNHWTVSGKQAFGIEFMAHVTQKLKAKEGNKIFKMYGFSNEDLVKLRKSPTFNEKGVEYIDVQELPIDLQRKWVAMTLSETAMAIPEPDVGVRAILNQGTRSGTWVGEVFRSGTQFKSFPATIVTGHLARMWNQTGGAKGRLAYGASLVASTTIMGTMAVIAKDFANKGEKPTKDSLTPALLFKGFVQGGSGAFVVDLLAAQGEGGFGQGITEMLAGPTAGTIDRVLFDIAFGEGKKVVTGKKTPIEGSISLLAKELEQFIPNLPFFKLMMKREVTAAMHKMGDNKWQRKQRRYQRQRKKETGNEYWYKN